MGHYRSEMISDEEYDKEIRDRDTRRNKRASLIKQAIEKEGLEFVLADIVDNPTTASIRFMP